MRCAKVDRHNLLYRMGRALTNALPSPKAPQEGLRGRTKRKCFPKGGACDIMISENRWNSPKSEKRRKKLLLEKTVLKFIQTKFRGRIGDAVMPAISALGNAGAVWLLLGAAYVCVPEGRRLGAGAFCGTCSGAFFVQCLA